MSDEINGVLIELFPDEEGDLAFSVGASFGPEITEEGANVLLDCAAGLFGLLSGQISQVMQLGQIVRSVSDFDEITFGDLPGDDIVFEPEEGLLDSLDESEKDDKVIDFKKAKFNPKKDRSH